MNDVLFCPWEPATFLFISSNVPPLVHYSHYVAIFAALSIALLVFLNDPRSTVARLFLLFSGLFSTWTLFDVGLWSTNDPAVVMFLWSMQVLIEPLTFAVALLLFYIYLKRKMPPVWSVAATIVLLLPLVIFLPTPLNLEALYLSSCETAEGPLAQYYTYVVNLLFTTAIVLLGLRVIPTITELKRRKSAKYFVFGLVTFLLTFTSGNIISSFTDDWTISQYGLFGMPIFAALIAYSIVQFRAFKIEIAAAQILVVTILALISSLLLVDDPRLSNIVAGATFFFALAVGFLLIRSVRNEFLQRLQLEELTTDLEKANVRLKTLDKQKSEFVSIASHQLRSPLTSIRGYASMLIEGSFGSIPEKAKEPLERIETSAKRMALAVEDYLNVSRIESGNMKYELADFNLKDEIERICDDVRPTALKAGLVLLFRTNLQSKGIVHADVGKTVQMAHNLINNSIKYTKKGSITVFVRDDLTKKLMYVDVIDTGVGMSQDTIDILFQKFSRADGANKVNTTGTGLGLFVAHKMAEAMGGDITAHSEGEGKGSRFTLTLPLAM
jgi:signal transduction histidine kinase